MYANEESLLYSSGTKYELDCTCLRHNYTSNEDLVKKLSTG